MSIQEAEILAQYDKAPEEILEDLFNLESPWDRKDFAVADISFPGKHNPKQRYGSYKGISRERLQEHDYTVSITDTRPRKLIIHINDVSFDEETWETETKFEYS